MRTFMTQSKRVESSGLLATPCIPGRRCSESGQSKNITYNLQLPNKKGESYAEVTLV